MMKFAIISTLITGYLVLGVIFSVLIHDTKPTILKEKKWMRMITQTIFPIVWLPYLVLNLCVARFIKVDIWYRRMKE